MNQLTPSLSFIKVIVSIEWLSLVVVHAKVCLDLTNPNNSACDCFELGCLLVRGDSIAQCVDDPHEHADENIYLHCSEATCCPFYDCWNHPAKCKKVSAEHICLDIPNKSVSACDCPFKEGCRLFRSSGYNEYQCVKANFEPDRGSWVLIRLSSTNMPAKTSTTQLPTLVWTAWHSKRVYGWTKACALQKEQLVPKSTRCVIILLERMCLATT